MKSRALFAKKHLRFIIALCCLPFSGWAQSIYIQPGATVTVSGAGTIRLEGTFENRGTFTAGDGTVVFQEVIGNGTPGIGGTNPTSFNNLTVNLQTKTLYLLRNIGVEGTVNFTSGLFDLNGFDLTLGTNGLLMNESETSRCTGLLGGSLIKTMSLNFPVGINPGNLGATFNSSANLGLTTIRRSHVPNNVNGLFSIERIFSISPANNTGLDATLRFDYFDAELNGLNESNLILWKKVSGIWTPQPATVLDDGLNFLELENISGFSEWTAAEACKDGMGNLVDPQTWYEDADGDGYGDPASSPLLACDQPVGYVSNNTDCNDNASAINPAASEICDGIDNNCNGSTDEGVQTTYYRDMDGDGFGNPSNTTMACSLPSGYVTNNTDCDDNNPALNPNTIWYLDADNDYYYVNGSAVTQCTSPGAGYRYTGLVGGGDCNDNAASINPAATEVCDGIDNDCDGLTDTNDPGFVDNTSPTVSCAGQVTLVFNGENIIQIDGVNGPVDLQIQASDNCGVQSITISPSIIYANQVGQTVPVIITVTDFKGATATCNSSIVVSGLPEGWSAQPNGVGCSNGNSAQYNTGTGVWTATSSNCFYGTPFTSDATSFAQRTLCGNGSITARVTGINPLAGGWAGIVMRESNAPGAKKAQLMTNLGSDHRREFRISANGQAFPQQFPSQSRYWLRITRVGNQFTMFVSPNGVNWSPVGTQNIVMSNCIQMGLTATNYTANSTVTATFAGVSFSGSNAGLGTGGGREQRAESLRRSSTGAKEGSIEGLHSFEVYPNPTSGDLNVDLTQYIGRSVRLEVYSLEGKLLQFSELDEVQSTLEHLDLKDFQNGMYLIKVKSDGLPEVTKRIVLQRG